MNHRTAEEWILAHRYCEEHPGAPRILAKVAKEHFPAALKAAVPYKAPIRIPRALRLPSVKALKAKAWAAFSKWIRQRDADENGLVKCCTCPTVLPWKQMHAGHFESRVKESAFFDEQNVHGQCPGCNMPPNNGMRIEYAAFLDEKYGAGTAKAIRARARREAMTREKLEEILNKYRSTP